MVPMEMEKDCVVGHGAAMFLKERMSDDSDINAMYVCDDCGFIAQRKKNKEVWYCPYCQDEGSGTSKVIAPYAFKTLVQELVTARILPGIMT